MDWFKWCIVMTEDGADQRIGISAISGLVKSVVGGSTLATRAAAWDRRHQLLAESIIHRLPPMPPADAPIWAFRTVHFVQKYSEAETVAAVRGDLRFRLVELSDWCDGLPVDDSVIGFFEGLCKDREPDVVVTSAECLGRVKGGARAISILLEVLEKGDERIAIRAAEAGARVLYAQFALCGTPVFSSSHGRRGGVVDLFIRKALELPLSPAIEEFLTETGTVLPRRVCLIDITPEFVQLLRGHPEEIFALSPDRFEELVCDRLREMGLIVERVGGHSFRKDGGIDIVAWPASFVFPFLLAVQVKHHRVSSQQVGPAPVRELLGAIQNYPFSLGLLVTNTTFTPDATWFASKRSGLLRLRDTTDLKRWLNNDFGAEDEWREVPTEIEICPGTRILLPTALHMR
jgi:hypothetical protein